MKNLLIIFLTLVSSTSIGQLSKRFTAIHKLSESGDTSYVNVTHFYEGKLIHKEDQIKIRVKTSMTKRNNKNLLDAHTIKTISNGNSTEWYLNGQLKCKGTFTYDKKNSDWKYWNENGDEIPEPNASDELHISGKTITIFIDGIEIILPVAKN